MLFRRHRTMPSSLAWGIRESLIRYVTQLPDGIVAVDDGADFVRDTHPPRFLFTEASRTIDEIRFTGTVLIAGHGGMLRVAAVDPWITLAAEGAVLSVGTEPGGDHIPVATVPLTRLDDSQTVPARLTPEGAAWLGPSYAAGDDASTVHLPRTTRRDSPTPTTGGERW